MTRNFTVNPYSNDEKRIVNWLTTLSPDMGGGDDPIGFFISSYEYVIHERKALKQEVEALIEYGLDLKRQVAALQLDNDRLYALMTNEVNEKRDIIDAVIRDGHERGVADMGEDLYQITQTFVQANTGETEEIIRKAGLQHLRNKRNK